MEKLYHELVPKRKYRILRNGMSYIATFDGIGTNIDYNYFGTESDCYVFSSQYERLEIDLSQINIYRFFEFHLFTSSDKIQIEEYARKRIISCIGKAFEQCIYLNQDIVRIVGSFVEL